MQETRIRDCPASPNCVSSQSEDLSHYVRPLAFETTPDVAWSTLRKAVSAEPRARILESDDVAHYLRAESTSRVFRFVDDLECQLLPSEKLILVRSASRVGHWDLGVNRRRVERLRRRFAQLLAQP